MSEDGSWSRRPYPPIAASAVPGGGSARSQIATRAASTSSVRRAATERPWWPIV